MSGAGRAVVARRVTCWRFAPAGTHRGAGRVARLFTMTSALMSSAAIARTGMAAALAGLGAQGHNLANAATDGFRRQQVQSATQAGGGVATTLTPAAQPGAALETDVVGLLQSKNAFLANLAVFRAGDAALGSLLDATG